jgi:hypothetical protein
VARAALIALLVAGSSAVGLGAPLARQRAVLADPDPELRHAMEQALAPWHLELVIEGPAPADASKAQERADADTARFVVWRDGAQLVVYDSELGSIERRDSRSGVLDPPTAAAAALTIKTMMRLPPPPAADEKPAPVPAAAEAAIELRLQAGVATRIARGSDTDVSMRFGGIVAIRPWHRADLWIGAGGDGGTATGVNRASFKGTWSEWSALGVIGWSVALGAWELEPHAGLGIRHSTLDGTEMGSPRTETATLTTGRGGVYVRWRYSRLRLGVALDLEAIFGTPTYTKTSTPAEVFQVPGSAIELGAILAVEL